MTDHKHNWHKTGEFYATNPPIWFFHCLCGALGTARDGREVEYVGTDPEFKYCYEVCDKYRNWFVDVEQPDEEWRTSEYIIPEHQCDISCETCGCCHTCDIRWYCNQEGEIVIKKEKYR